MCKHQPATAQHRRWRAGRQPPAGRREHTTQKIGAGHSMLRRRQQRVLGRAWPLHGVGSRGDASPFACPSYVYSTRSLTLEEDISRVEKVDRPAVWGARGTESTLDLAGAAIAGGAARSAARAVRRTGAAAAPHAALQQELVDVEFTCGLCCPPRHCLPCCAHGGGRPLLATLAPL